VCYRKAKTFGRTTGLPLLHSRLERKNKNSKKFQWQTAKTTKPSPRSQPTQTQTTADATRKEISRKERKKEDPISQKARLISTGMDASFFVNANQWIEVFSQLANLRHHHSLSISLSLLLFSLVSLVSLSLFSLALFNLSARKHRRQKHKPHNTHQFCASLALRPAAALQLLLSLLLLFTASRSAKLSQKRIQNKFQKKGEKKIGVPAVSA